MTAARSCRFCGAALSHVVVDLGMSPLSNPLVDPARSGDSDESYPLCAHVCDRCWLVQLTELATPQRIFGDYAYFSSYSTTWLEHARRFAEDIVARLSLSARNLVVEVASSDGYLLKYFRERSIPVLGIEPAHNVARAAIESGIPTLCEFFGTQLAQQLVSEGRRADLIIGNNVLAHVPNLNDFVSGLRELLAPGGTVTLEFPHLLRTIERGEFDTIYHEHFSYFSLLTAQRVLSAHGLTITDADELPTHGGSLRIYARHAGDARGTGSTKAVAAIIAQERTAGLETLAGYAALQERANETKRALLQFLTAAARSGARVAGYGAPAKAPTRLNYCGIDTRLLAFTVDRNPHKQGRLIPGVRIPSRHRKEYSRTNRTTS